MENEKSLDVTTPIKKRKSKTADQKIIKYQATIESKQLEIEKLKGEIKQLENKIEEIRLKQNEKDLAQLNEYLAKNNCSPKDLLIRLISEKEENNNA